jgi:phosphoglycerol transferase MdoB-like AlkP superfamily enzyme
MPHNPYYYDKDGKELKYELLRKIYDSTETRYISYLQYCNKVFLQLIDDIKSNSPEPPIIILMSDHGFKGYNNYEHVQTYFSNFNSIYLPDSNYQTFYKGISNVNQFRVLLNSQFNQQLPLLKDSTIIITE